MNDKLKLEALLLKSLFEYPEKINAFLDKTSLKCFSELGSELLNAILSLKQKNLLNIESLNVELKDELKNSPFFMNFLAALPSIMIDELSEMLVKAYKLETQKKLMQDLEKANANNELLDLELLQKENEINSKSFMNLRQWMAYYETRPILPQIKTGIPFLESAFNGGLELGQLILIGGDPEAGKTRLGLQMLEFMSKSHKVAFFCFEFTIESYLKIVQEKGLHSNAENLIILNDGYNIFELADNIRTLYRQGVKVFFIDSQMRVTNEKGRNMEEEETLKFSTLARLCHSLNIIIFFVIQNSKNDKENPMNSKKGAHEASIIIRVERCAPDKKDLAQQDNLYDENARFIVIQKNKQTGKHFKEKVFYSTQSLKFYPLNNILFPTLKQVSYNDVLREISNDKE